MRKWRRFAANSRTTANAACKRKFSTPRHCGKQNRICGSPSPEDCWFAAIPFSTRPARPPSCWRRRAGSAQDFISSIALQAIGKGSVSVADGRSFSANYIVNATGQDAPKLTPGINIKPRKGHLVITDRYPGFIRHQLVELGYLKSAHVVTSDSVAFNVQPRRTGQILIGSSRQYDIASGEVDSTILARMLAARIRICPAAGFHVQHPHLDWISRGDAGQASADRSVARRPEHHSSCGARGPGHHHVTGNRPPGRGSNSWPQTGDTRRAILARRGKCQVRMPESVTVRVNGKSVCRARGSNGSRRDPHSPELCRELR